MRNDYDIERNNPLAWTSRQVRIRLQRAAPEKPKVAHLYALLVGIDQYPSLPPLAGCVNDVVAVEEFLNGRVDHSLAQMEITTLLDQEATRENVISQFENIASKVEENDTLLFFFAGYGSQEPAPAEFRAEETDSLNETIVLFDSRMGRGTDLADKEIATLLEQVTSKGAHVVVVSDCSHNDNTEAITAENCRVAPRYPRIRPITSYILPGTFQSASSKSSSSYSGIVFPVPDYYSLSAVSGQEAAKEIFINGKVQGIFTATLLETLRSSSDISYRDLITRLKTRMAQRTSGQVPMFDFFGNREEAAHVLNGLLQLEMTGIQMTWDKSQWIVNRGLSHGFRGEGIEGETMILAVYSQHDIFFEKPLGEAEVISVENGFCVVNTGNLSLSPGEPYRIRVVNVPVLPVKIHFSGEEEQAITLKKAFLSSREAIYLKEVNEPPLADYQIVAEPGRFSILRPSDRREKPLLPPVDGSGYEAALESIRQINHIARWRQILELSNPGSGLENDSIRLEIFPVEGDTPISGETLTYASWEQGVGFRVKLINQAPRRLYVSLLFLAGSFEISSQFLPESAVWLEPGEEVWALDGNPFRAVVNEQLIKEGVFEVQEIFKLIYAADTFNPRSLEQAGIEEIQQPVRGLKETGSSFLLFAGRTVYFDWNTKEVPLTVRMER
ncbi:MAG: caspase family protein [Bacteroidia bacterium]